MWSSTVSCLEPTVTHAVLQPSPVPPVGEGTALSFRAAFGRTLRSLRRCGVSRGGGRAQWRHGGWGALPRIQPAELQLSRLGSREGARRQQRVPSLPSAQSPACFSAHPGPCLREPLPSLGHILAVATPPPAAEPFPGAPCACPRSPCCWLALHAPAVRFLDP